MDKTSWTHSTIYKTVKTLSDRPVNYFICQVYTLINDHNNTEGICFIKLLRELQKAI